ncbi:uncharacterized protein LOC117109505 [Anneissia japonica]|uniref:uncharacterized protein LOC117109505 n=1 Tax=Anneissia japonica TaxID=1529436 RepID=UPI0014258902|nr:uncharacterized protein LOC117109505 [Anneissia japonica]
MTSQDITDRQIMVEEAMGGEFLLSNETLPCPPSLALSFNDERLLSPRTLKMLLLGSFLFVFMAIYFSLEQAFCNDEEKDEYQQTLGDSKENANNDIEKEIIDHNTSETARLLAADSETELANNSIDLEGNNYNSVNSGCLQKSSVQSKQTIPEQHDPTFGCPVGDHLCASLENLSDYIQVNSGSHCSGSAAVRGNSDGIFKKSSIRELSNRKDVFVGRSNDYTDYRHWPVSSANLFNTDESRCQGTL